MVRNGTARIAATLCLSLLFSFLLGVRVILAQTTAAPKHQIFQLDSFALEGGVTLPEAKLAYVTFGKLNAKGSNAVLLPSAYGGDYHDYEFLIGQGRALDSTRYYIVATEMFGNGVSSSPSNTPAPFHGPRFPVIT